MSSLTRSLLALAVLLVAANAQDNCIQETFGQTTIQTVPMKTVVTSRGGGRVTTQDGCPSKYGYAYVAVGETVTACNIDVSGEAPYIEQVNPPDLSPVDVVCPDGCRRRATVDITQHCAEAYSS